MLPAMTKAGGDIVRELEDAERALSSETSD